MIGGYRRGMGDNSEELEHEGGGELGTTEM